SAGGGGPGSGGRSGARRRAAPHRRPALPHGHDPRSSRREPRGRYLPAPPPPLVPDSGRPPQTTSAPATPPCNTGIRGRDEWSPDPGTVSPEPLTSWGAQHDRHPVGSPPGRPPG